MAATTVEKRSSMVRRWAQFVGDPFDPALTWRDVDRFVDSTSMTASVSRYAAVSHIHQFYLWAMRAELVHHDPTVLVVRPRIVPGLPRPAHDTDLAVGLAVSTGPMHAAIVLMSLCGLRCLEVCRLRWSDVGIDAIRVTGKGGRDRVLPLPERARDALDLLERVDEWVFPWRESGDISPGRRTSAAINQFFRSTGAETTAHQLRHWCGTNAYRVAGDLGTVQDYLGHASPATTRIYARLDPSKLRAVSDAICLPNSYRSETDDSDAPQVRPIEAPV
jgi:integrase